MVGSEFASEDNTTRRVEATDGDSNAARLEPADSGSACLDRRRWRICKLEAVETTAGGDKDKEKSEGEERHEDDDISKMGERFVESISARKAWLEEDIEKVGAG